jgi:hypothetical protein
VEFLEKVFATIMNVRCVKMEAVKDADKVFALNNWQIRLWDEQFELEGENYQIYFGHIHFRRTFRYSRRPREGRYVAILEKNQR